MALTALGGNRVLTALQIRADSFADGTGDEERDEPCEQQKERRFGLLPVKGNVDELKNREEQTTQAPHDAFLPSQDDDPQPA
jgi:hypothetical protein